MTILNVDRIKVVRQNVGRIDAEFSIDLPYTVAGKRAGRRLYTLSVLDHEELFRVVADVEGDFLMTYDVADGVHDLADAYGFDKELIAMKNTHHAEMTELLIGCDLTWARQHEHA